VTASASELLWHRVHSLALAATNDLKTKKPAPRIDRRLRLLRVLRVHLNASSLR
jgi:hypothetical protein